MIEFKKVSRHYEAKGQATVHALREVDLTIDQGDFLAVTGESGCGKSTLLHLLGALDSPSLGQLIVDDLPLHTADEAAKTAYRRSDVGIVFQFFNLMPTMSVAENVGLPLLLQGISESEACSRSEEAMDLVGISHRARHFQHELSGGEMQRCAIARALVHKPKLLIADEPTGNLDSANAVHILSLFQKLHKDTDMTMVVVTHSEEVAAGATRRIRMEDGRIVSEG